MHNFDHLHEMLRTLDWLVPADTRSVMTKSDWLLLTLSCYFHDLGLLVTRDEFEARDESTFHNFCEGVLFSGPDGADYRAKVDELSAERRKKFLYQEFVRCHHATRVRNWVMGKPNVALGQATAAAEEINRLLSPLAAPVRVDLANICESHNLDDLDNDSKYPLYRPYGRSDEEATNVQYVAILLRTTDLLQITNQRASSVLFKTINPKDPTSQVEWLKQNAVKHIRPQPKADRSGEVSREVQGDTVEIYADFTNPDGFFGLTSYLTYAGKELQRSFELAERSKKALPKKYNFPWRYIDDAHIKTEGFLPKKYGFELDQERILDLLTGHTLYNDSAVVVRELAQNAIDAVRLQAFEDKQDSNVVGEVGIYWDSKTSELEIIDNGTGMTRAAIEKHLLKVGSSRYQDPKFKEDHPNFSSISRFGIGVLSAFMVADTVEITTCSPDEQHIHEISLRSVHGRYLVRLLEKGSDPKTAEIFPHGTKFKLKLRASAAKVDILEAVRRWIVFPRCKVTVSIDDAPPVGIGFVSPKKALEHYLSELLGESLAGTKYRVEEVHESGVALAYGVRFDELFRDWAFISFPERLYGNRAESDETRVPGICIEGIAVQFKSPGFDQGGIVAIANATGANAPKTDVARSSLENTPESREITRKAYDIYVKQIDRESTRLIKEEDYSLSWAAEQVEFLARPLLDRTNISDDQLLSESLTKLRMFLLEDDEKRQTASIDDLIAKGGFWTAYSPLTWSVEHLVKEMPGNITARSIFGLANTTASCLPSGYFVANATGYSMALEVMSRRFEVSEIRGLESSRRLEFRWTLKEKDSNWLSSARIFNRLVQLNPRSAVTIDRFFDERSRVVRRSSELLIPLFEMTFNGLEHFSAVAAGGTTYFQTNIPSINYIKNILKDNSLASYAEAYVYLKTAQTFLFARSPDPIQIRQRLEQRIRDMAAKGLHEFVPHWEEFGKLLQANPLTIFDPFAWSRRSSDKDDELSF